MMHKTKFKKWNMVRWCTGIKYGVMGYRNKSGDNGEPEENMGRWGTRIKHGMMGNRNKTGDDGVPR